MILWCLRKWKQLAVESNAALKCLLLGVLLQELKNCRAYGILQGHPGVLACLEVKPCQWSMFSESHDESIPVSCMHTHATPRSIQREMNCTYLSSSQHDTVRLTLEVLHPNELWLFPGCSTVLCWQHWSHGLSAQFGQATGLSPQRGDHGHTKHTGRWKGIRKEQAPYPIWCKETFQTPGVLAGSPGVHGEAWWLWRKDAGRWILVR